MSRSTDPVSWWQHPGHLRKCKLAGENVLDRVRARHAARERRKVVTKALLVTFSILVTIFTVVVMASVALGAQVR